MEKLIKMFNLENLKNTEHLTERFNKLANILLQETAIQKGEKLYILRDIEFYFYSSTHRDIITYPRNSKGGEWFFHDSGVDLSFESHIELKENSKGILKPYLTEKATFGGILIRAIDQIEKTSTGFKVIKSISGPLNTTYELFDQFNAFSAPDNFPTLISSIHGLATSESIHTKERFHLLQKGKTVEEKVENILKYNYSGKENIISSEELIHGFSHFLNAPYRYISLRH